MTVRALAACADGSARAAVRWVIAGMSLTAARRAVAHGAVSVVVAVAEPCPAITLARAERALG